MKPLPVTLLFVLAVFLQEGLRSWWSVGEAAPEPLLIVVAYLALLAPASAAVLMGLVGGLLADLISSPFEGAAIVGPRALGFTVGAYAIVLARSSLFRGSTFTLVTMVLLGGFFAELVATALVTLRGVGPLPGLPPRGWVAGTELWHRLGCLVLTAVAAIPLGLGLMAGRKWVGLERTGK